MLEVREPDQPSGLGGVLQLNAANVTGTRRLPVEVDAKLSAGAVAESIREAMALPRDVAWALRDDESSAYLDDQLPIGEQVGSGAQVVLYPKAHLG